MLCAPICAIQYNIPIVHAYMDHVQDNAEECIRNAITNLTEGKFVATQEYKNKISKINKTKNNIKVTGLVGFEEIN